MDFFRWMELSSRQYKRYILEGGDMAALPVGSMEVMGPHLPVGSMFFIAKAIAEEFCRAHGGLCLPAVPLSPISGKKERGGVDMDCQVLLDYLEDVAGEVLENGIRRFLLVGFFPELYYTIAEVFRTHDIPLAHIDLNHVPVLAGMNRYQKYNALTAGSLKMLGEEELLAKMLAANESCLKKGDYRAPDGEQPVKGLLNILETEWSSGVLPHRYGEDEYKILPTEGIDAEAAAQALKAWVADKADALAAFGAYSQVMPRARYDRGMRMGGSGYEE